MINTVMGDETFTNSLDVDIYFRGADGKGISSIKTYYAEGVSGIVHPESGWSETIPSVAQGKYLWEKIEITYSTGSVSTTYMVTYFSIDGGYYIPTIQNGIISWTYTESAAHPTPASADIRGPKGEVKFIEVEELPTENIENDAFYFVPADNASATRLYDKYAYINGQWENFEQDLDNYYTKAEVDTKAFTIKTKSVQPNTTYYIAGLRNAGPDQNADVYNTYSDTSNSGITYIKNSNEAKGRAYIDGQEITTNIYSTISNGTITFYSDAAKTNQVKATQNNASTSTAGIVQLSSALNSSDETKAATAKAIKDLKDLFDNLVVVDEIEY